MKQKYYWLRVLRVNMSLTSAGCLLVILNTCVLFWIINFRYTIFLHLENRNNTGTYILPTFSKWWTTELEKILHRIWKKKDLEDYKNDANRARYWSNSCCIMFYYIKVRKPDMSWVLMINSQKHLRTWKYNYRNQLKYLLRITIYYSQ